jgi:HAE1 family hydrophobic/amphiphilic exporter-1
MLLLFFTVVGLTARSKLSVDMFPEIDFPVVTVMTVYPGAGPEEVETLISKKIEDGVSSIDGIDEISSASQEGLSFVVVRFVLEKKIEDAATEVREKVGLIKNSLPEDAEDPVISRLDFNAQPIINYGITSDSMDEVALRDWVDKNLKKQLERIRGVASIEIIGGAEREIRVELSKARMEGMGIGPDAVAMALRQTNFDFPAGNLAEGGQDLSLKVTSQFADLSQIGETIISAGGRNFRLAEIARITDGSKEQESKARVNGKAGVGIAIQKQSGANTVDVAEKVKARMDELASQVPAGIEITLASDESRFIAASIDDIYLTIIIAIILATIVVLLFLGSGRVTFATLLTMPVSIIATFALFMWADFTINFMSLLALAVAVGLVVDDAIVVAENIYRHLEMGKPPKIAAAEGAMEVQLAVLAATFSIVAVFIPIGFMEGIMGRFFRQFGLGVAFSMLISIVVALTLIPVVMAYSYRVGITHEEIERRRLWISKVFLRLYLPLEAGYERLIRWVLTYKLPVIRIGRLWIGPTGRNVVIGISTLSFVFAMALASKLTSGFIPRFDTGFVAVDIELSPDVDLAATERVVKEIEDRLSGGEYGKYIVTKFASLGKVQAGFGTSAGKNRGAITLRLTPEDTGRPDSYEIASGLAELLSGIPGATVKVAASGGEGGQTDFSVFVVNPDRTRLDKAVEILAAKLDEVDGTVDVDASNKKGKLELAINPDIRKVADAGLTPVGLAAALRGYIEGTELGTFRERGEEYDITMYLAPEDSDTVDKLRNILVYSPALGTFVVLSSLAEVYVRPGVVARERYNRTSSVQLSCNIDPSSPRGVGDIRKDFLAAVKTAQLPPDTKLEFAGEAKFFIEMVQQLGFAMILGILFVYMVLASQFNSLVHPFNIMLTLPLAVVGAIVAVFITGTSFNLMSFMGIVMLTGLVTKNAILLIDYTNQLMAQGKDRFTALVEAGKRRLRPIIMTTLTATLGLVPVAIGYGEGGGFRQPMGIAIIGGLVLSTLLTLVVIPVAYTISDDITTRFRKRVGSE